MQVHATRSSRNVNCTSCCLISSSTHTVDATHRRCNAITSHTLRFTSTLLPALASGLHEFITLIYAPSYLHSSSYSAPSPTASPPALTTQHHHHRHHLLTPTPFPPPPLQVVRELGSPSTSGRFSSLYSFNSAKHQVCAAQRAAGAASEAAAASPHESMMYLSSAGWLRCS